MFVFGMAAYLHPGTSHCCAGSHWFGSLHIAAPYADFGAGGALLRLVMP
jgi:hypothetical protein